MAHCINIKHQDYQDLLKSGLNSHILSAKIMRWQIDNNDYENYPSLQEILENNNSNNTPIKKGVKDLFEQNSELSQIGTLQQYSQYLNSIFPDSKIKDIVYHGGNTTDFVEREEWTYFTNDKKYAFNYGKVYSALLNVINGTRLEDTVDKTKLAVTYLEQLKNKDGVIGKESFGIVKKGDNNFMANGQEVIAVRKPEQIHILESKQDIEGFDNFVKKHSKNIIKKEEEFNLPILKTNC